MDIVGVMLFGIGAVFVWRLYNRVADKIENRVVTPVAPTPPPSSGGGSSGGGGGGGGSSGFGGGSSAPSPAPAAPGRSGVAKVLPTAAGVVSANYYASTNDPNHPWCRLTGCQHKGVDYAGAAGTPVRAPVAMRNVVTGYYPQKGVFGAWIIGTTPEGYELYLGHLDKIDVAAGSDVAPGTILGRTNSYNHTHVQLKIGGQLADFEEYYRSL